MGLASAALRSVANGSYTSPGKLLQFMLCCLCVGLAHMCLCDESQTHHHLLFTALPDKGNESFIAGRKANERRRKGR